MATSGAQDIARELIVQGRSYYVELVSAVRLSPEGRVARDLQDIARDIGEAIVAFANSDGGDLLVGVEESGQVTGIPYDGDKLLYLVQAPKYQVEAPDFGVRVHEVMLDDRRVLLFRVVGTSSTIAVTAEGRCLWRKDDASRPVAPHEIERRRDEHRGDTHDEAEPVPRATLDDIAFPPHPRIDELMRTFRDDRELVLRYWNLVEGRNGHLVLKRAALLLFAREPLRWHPNNRVRLRRILGEDPGYGADKRTRESEHLGPIVPLIGAVKAALRTSLEVERRLDGHFVVSHTLPEQAVDECLLNALVHRNYAIEGNAIEVLVYPDRVEFHSPGALPRPLTLDDLRRQNGAHRARNPLIMRVLRDLRETRDEGEGMRRIFGAMSQVELHEPQLEERADTFIVRLSTRSRYNEDTQSWLASYGPFGLQPRHRKYVIALREASYTAPSARRAGGRKGGFPRRTGHSIDRLARQLGESFDVTRQALAELEELGLVWHRARSRAYHLVEPFNVPSERFYRLLTGESSVVEPDATFTHDGLVSLLHSPGAAAARRDIDSLQAMGALEPAGRGKWRLGPSFRAYLVQRRG